MWCLPLLWASTSTTRSFVAACATGWGSPYTVLHTLVPSVGESLTHLEIIRLGVEETETVSPAIMLSGMCSSVWLGPRLWLPLKRLLAWCLAPAPDQQTSFTLPGVGVAPQPRPGCTHHFTAPAADRDRGSFHPRARPRCGSPSETIQSPFRLSFSRGGFYSPSSRDIGRPHQRHHPYDSLDRQGLGPEN